MGFLDKFRKNKNKKDDEDKSKNMEKTEPVVSNFNLERTKSTTVTQDNLRNFKYLYNLLNSGSKQIVLDSDITFDYNTDSEFIEGILIDKDDITIEGRGYSINASNKSKFFKVNGKNIHFKNIIFKNSYAKNKSSIINNGSLTIENSNFNDITSVDGAITNNVSCKLKITNTKFLNNSSEGGAATIFNLGNVEISDSKFSNNSGNIGGVIKNQHSANLEIFKCEFSNNDSKKYAGAIINSGKMFVKDSKFKYNSAPTWGTVYNEGTSEIENCRFLANKTEIRSGAVYNFSYLTVKKSIFAKNSSKYGSSIFNEGNLEVCQCDFEDNSNTSSGTIYNKNQDSKATVINSNFMKNHSDEYGGAIFSEGELEVNDCNFTENSALDGGAIGTLQSSSLSIEDCEFMDNVSEDKGGAIYSNCASKLKGVDFKKNNAKEGAGIWCGQYAILKMENSNFFHNKTGGTGTIFNWGEIDATNITLKNNISKENVVCNYNILKFSKSTFAENACETNSAIISNQGKMEIFKSNFFKQNGNIYISNEISLKIVESNFEDNDLLVVVKNEEKASLSLLSCNFINNSNEIATIHNLGEYCGVMGSVFKNNSSLKEFCKDIYNESVLSLQDPKFKTEKISKSILNNGHINIRKFKRSQARDYIQDNGTMDFLSYDAEETINQYNFTFLDDLVHGKDKTINLKEDIKIDNYEIDFYEGGIELDVDDLTIKGNGIIIDANNKSRIFRVSGKNITLENITFKNGALFNIFEEHTTGGGAIKIIKDGSLTLKNCKFINNISDDDGGAILNNGELTSLKSHFDNNESKLFGGAIYNNYECDLKEDNFNYNKSDVGGAIYNYGEMILDNLKLKENTSNVKQHIVNNKTYQIKNMSENVADVIFDIGGNVTSEEQETDPFCALNEVINESDELKLLNDVIFDKDTDAIFKDGIHIANENLVIDGDGFSIDAIESATIFNIKRISTVVFKNVTFKNGFSKEKPIILNEGEVTFENCKFENNISKEKSVIENKNSLKILNCSFSNNESETHILSNNGDLNINDSNFFNNNSQKGSIIYNDKDSTLSIINSEYISNKADVYGIVFNGYEMVVKDSKFITNYAVMGASLFNMSNLCINHCEFSKNSADVRGGALYNRGSVQCVNSKFEGHDSKEGTVSNETGTIKIKECEFINNKSNYGAAIMNFSEINLSESKFVNNNSSEGGAINNQPNAKININKCEFADNKSEQGGAINNKSFITLSKSIFKNNSASIGGAFMNSVGGISTMDNCEFIGNNSEISGGTIYNMYKIMIQKSRFNGNYSISEDYGYSGVIHNDDESVVYIEDSEFINNKSKLGASVILNNAILDISNSKFIDNSTELNGGVIYNNENSTFEHRNCEFKGNVPNDYN